MPIDPNMNLELDLGFDSMERIELLASLEQALNLELPEDFGAEIFDGPRPDHPSWNSRRALSPHRSPARQSWKTILSGGVLEPGGSRVISPVRHSAERSSNILLCD